MRCESKDLLGELVPSLAEKAGGVDLAVRRTVIFEIGVHRRPDEIKGLDALLSIVQMPAGVPVACVALGSAGAKNAAYLAAEILGLKHDRIREAYENYRRELSNS